MKLDVHDDFGPVIRLHDFDHDELQHLRDTVGDLAAVMRSSVPLHEEPYVESLGGCRLTLRLGATDEGIQPTVDPNLFGWIQMPGTWCPFACTLTPEGWNHVVRGIDLLLQLRCLSSEYVWLHKLWHGHTHAAWLLSPTGEW